MSTKLTVELVPSTCWGSNLRSELTTAQWRACQQFVYARSGRRCEICGGVGSKWPVECHEIWEYDDDRLVQTLTGLIALCPSCHACKHAGFSAQRGLLADVLLHLCAVNEWPLEHVELYLEAVFEVHNRRSQHQWDLDTTWLRSLGLPGELLSAAERQRRAEFLG